MIIYNLDIILSKLYIMSCIKINHIIKYILIGLITVLAIKYIPKTTLLQDEIITIGIVVSIAYAIIDTILPSVYIKKTEENDE